MDYRRLAGRVALSALFGTAGSMKLRDSDRSVQALTDFGVPRERVRMLALLLPLTELAVSVALLPMSTFRWAARTASALLIAFNAVIVVNLVRGRRPRCGCFGEIGSAHIGPSMLGRNFALLAIAGFLAVPGSGDGPSSSLRRYKNLSPAARAGIGAGLAGSVLLVLEACLLVEMLRRYGTLLRRLDDAGIRDRVPALPIGTKAPDFALLATDSGEEGETTSLCDLSRDGRPVVLVFTAPGCEPCKELLPEIGQWQRDVEKAKVAVIGTGPVDENRAQGAENGLSVHLVQEKQEVSDAYRVTGTPSAVLVRPDGTIGSEIALGAPAIRKLVNGIV